jgi:hypothetical protein
LIASKTFKLAFGEPSKVVIRAKVFYFESDVRVIYHEHTIENYNLNNYIVRFPAKLEGQSIEYISIEDIQFSSCSLFGPRSANYTSKPKFK